MPTGIYIRTERNKHSEETRRKMSLAGKGRLKTKEWKEKIRYSLLGVKHTPERKLRISLGLKDKHCSPNTEFKIGHKMSLNVREKISKTMKEKKNHLWQGGITSLHTMIRNSFQYVEWKRAICKRDNYTCQECGQRNKLHVHHHKKKFSTIFREFLRIYDQFSPIEDKEVLVRLAFKYEPFWDTTNVKTVCEQCHKKTDNYGIKKCRTFPLLFLSLLLFSSIALAEPLPEIRGLDRAVSIQEEDGSPFIIDTRRIKVTNDTLLDNGDGTATLLIMSTVSADATYLRQDGTTPLTGNWAWGANDISGTGDLTTTGIGTLGTVDILNGTGVGLTVGADLSGSVRTNATRKVGRIGAPHYTNAERPVAILFVDAQSDSNGLYWGGGTGSTNAASFQNFYTAANNTTVSGTLQMSLRSTGNLILYNGNLGVGVTSPGAKIDVAEGTGLAFKFGADLNGGSTRTDNFRKVARIGAAHYSNEEQPTALLFIDSPDDNSALLEFGGGTSAMNAATSISFWTAANGITTTGTKRFSIESNGYVRFMEDNQKVAMGASGVTDYYQMFDGTDAQFYTSGDFVFTGGNISVLADNVEIQMGASGATDYYQKFDGTNAQFYTSGGHQFTGNLGIGIAPSDDAVSISFSPVNDTGAYGIDLSYLPQSTSTGSYAYRGFNFVNSPIISAGVTNSSASIGTFISNISGSFHAGTMASSYGVEVGYGHASAVPVTGVTTTCIGIYLRPRIQAGTIDTLYNIYIPALLTGGTLTNTYYSIYDLSTGHWGMLSDNTQFQMGASGVTDYYQMFDGTNAFFYTPAAFNFNTGDFFFSTAGSGLPYGHMYQTSGSTFTVTMTNQNDNYELDAATTNINAGEINLVTFDGDHYLEVDKAGRYLINYSFSAEIDSVAGGAQHVESCFMVNGTRVADKGQSHWAFAVTSTENTYAGTAILSLAADDEVSICVKNLTSAGKVLTIDHVNLTVVMCGG